MTKRRSLSPGCIKSKMPLSRLPRCAPARLISTSPRLLADLRMSTGLPVSKGGISAPLLMVRTIQGLPVFLPKHGAKFLPISGPHSSWQFSPTKICVASVKPSHQSAIMSCCRRSAVNALLRRRIWQELYLQLLHHSPTPSLHRSLTRSIKPANDRVPFSSPARSISLAKRSRICAANPPPSKNARSEFSETHHEGHRGHEDAFTFASPSCSSCSLWLIRSFNSWKQRHRLAHDMFIWQSPPLRVFE